MPSLARNKKNKNYRHHLQFNFSKILHNEYISNYKLNGDFYQWGHHGCFYFTAVHKRYCLAQSDAYLRIHVSHYTVLLVHFHGPYSLVCPLKIISRHNTRHLYIWSSVSFLIVLIFCTCLPPGGKIRNTIFYTKSYFLSNFFPT